MKVIYKPRAGGKTIEAIKLAAETDSYIVCLDCRECYRVAKLANELGYEIPFPLSFYEFQERLYCGAGVKSFIIDNADLLLQHLSSVPIVAVTMNRDEESWYYTEGENE